MDNIYQFINIFIFLTGDDIAPNLIFKAKMKIIKLFQDGKVYLYL